MLKLLDCEATGFLGARFAAQALLSGQCPDLIILDTNMPEVGRLDLLEYARRQVQWKNLPVIMLSTEAADVTVERVMELGADGYVSKPVTIEELEKAVNAAFSKHQKG